MAGHKIRVEADAVLPFQRRELADALLLGLRALRDAAGVADGLVEPEILVPVDEIVPLDPRILRVFRKIDPAGRIRAEELRGQDLPRDLREADDRKSLFASKES